MKNYYFKPTKTGFEYTGELEDCIKEAELDLFNLKINAKLCLGRTTKEKERLRKILETIEVYKRFILIGKKHIEREKEEKEKKANGKEL